MPESRQQTPIGAFLEFIQQQAASSRESTAVAADAQRIAAIVTEALGEKSDLLSRMLHEAREVADPSTAISNLERFLISHPSSVEPLKQLDGHPQSLHALLVLLGGSQFLSNVLIAQPESFEWLFSSGLLWKPRKSNLYADEARAAAGASDDDKSVRKALSDWRRREMLRIGLRDLLQLATSEEVTRDISDLAQAIISVAADLAYQRTAARFGLPLAEPADAPGSKADADRAAASGMRMCILGMGKLGGRELNFSSDIDLVFVYEAEGETAGRRDGARRVATITNHEFFARLGESLIKFLSERGPEGHLFRVDMRLRPEGQDGPLVRSLESFETYLSLQARDWERLAYLKARVLHGPTHLAERLYRVISAFVFAGIQPARIVREVEELKFRIDREVMGGELYHREVKRGYGGIREIEFVIACLQIIHGYNHHALRVRNTFLAIQRLREVHILSAADSAFYHEAYDFLRTLEHRLQMAEEHQTHTLPSSLAELTALARSCGYADAPDLLAAYRRITDDVHGRFVAFFEHDVESLDETNRDMMLILDRDSPEERAAMALVRQGITDPSALRLIHALAYGTRDIFISPDGQKFFSQMLPAILRLTAAAPFPQRVLPNLHSFALAVKGITYYYEVIVHHPEILRLLITLFGSSAFFSSALISHPEFFDALISSHVLDELDSDGVLRRERISQSLAARSMNRSLILLRRAILFENILAALRLLLGMRTLEECLADLAMTADEAIAAGMRLALRQIANRSDLPAADAEKHFEQLRSQFSVIALGKYGGRELNFFGDLDVVFVYDDSADASLAAAFGQQPTEFFISVSDTVTSVLSEQAAGGRAYQLDARLRPHGRNSPLAAARSEFEKYIRDEAAVWEFQALTRARTVWGTSGSEKAIRAAVRNACGKMPSDTLRSEVATMRQRLEESVSAAAGESVELKRSAGGLVDIEFLIQYLMLTNIASFPQAENYFRILEVDGCLALAPQDSESLCAAYRELRFAETAIRLSTDSGESVLPATVEVREAIAKLSASHGAPHPSQWQATKDAVRRIYAQYLPAKS